MFRKLLSLLLSLTCLCTKTCIGTGLFGGCGKSAMEESLGAQKYQARI